MEERVLEGLPYLLSYPEGFREDQKYPLLVFLHGAGFRSEVTDWLRDSSSMKKILAQQNARGFILLAPLCKRGTWYEWMMPLIHLVGQYRELAYVDKTHVHLTGYSMGGYGAWALATLYPNWFASAMPLCGGGIAGFAMNLVDLPIRAFHGLRDTTVDPIESIQMVKAINRRGGHAELILFPELEHSCWNQVYRDEKNFDWLFSFASSQDKDPMEDPSLAVYGKPSQK